MKNNRREILKLGSIVSLSALAGKNLLASPIRKIEEWLPLPIFYNGKRALVSDMQMLVDAILQLQQEVENLRK